LEVLGVVLAAPEPLFRLGMRLACERGGVGVLAEAADAVSLRTSVAQLAAPAVIVSDVETLEPDSASTVQSLSAMHRVLVLDAGPVDHPRLLRAGASGFLRRRAEPTSLCQAVARAHRGELVLEGAGSEPAAAGSDPVRLTTREVEVLRAIASGRSSDCAARELHMSTTTLKTHLRNASAKLGSANRAAAAARATQLGLL
jgi:DNA-binding NarL/FixJ family response regulator